MWNYLRDAPAEAAHADRKRIDRVAEERRVLVLVRRDVRDLGQRGVLHLLGLRLVQPPPLHHPGEHVVAPSGGALGVALAVGILALAWLPL